MLSVYSFPLKIPFEHLIEQYKACAAPICALRNYSPSGSLSHRTHWNIFIIQHRFSIFNKPQLRKMPPHALDMTTQSSSPHPHPPPRPQQPYPEYPIKIPPDKQGKALELYITLKLAELLAQNDPATHNDGYLLAPGPSTAHSVTSRTSSHRNGAPSTSASAYEGTTDFGGSVVSFDQNAPSMIEFTAYTGKKVKPRKRKRLNPTARAKAALVRYLGSCWPCRQRRVPVSTMPFPVQALRILLTVISAL